LKKDVLRTRLCLSYYENFDVSELDLYGPKSWYVKQISQAPEIKMVYEIGDVTVLESSLFEIWLFDLTDELQFDLRLLESDEYK